jgi:hypothetical protein
LEASRTDRRRCDRRDRGGVTDGVAGGIGGAIAGGIADGVAGGVAGGVSGGVSGALASEPVKWEPDVDADVDDSPRIRSPIVASSMRS